MFQDSGLKQPWLTLVNPKFHWNLYFESLWLGFICVHCIHNKRDNMQWHNIKTHCTAVHTVMVTPLKPCLPSGSDNRGESPAAEAALHVRLWCHSRRAPSNSRGSSAVLTPHPFTVPRLAPQWPLSVHLQLVFFCMGCCTALRVSPYLWHNFDTSTVTSGVGWFTEVISKELLKETRSPL